MSGKRKIGCFWPKIVWEREMGVPMPKADRHEACFGGEHHVGRFMSDSNAEHVPGALIVRHHSSRKCLRTDYYSDDEDDDDEDDDDRNDPAWPPPSPPPSSVNAAAAASSVCTMPLQLNHGQSIVQSVETNQEFDIGNIFGIKAEKQTADTAVVQSRASKSKTSMMTKPANIHDEEAMMKSPPPPAA